MRMKMFAAESLESAKAMIFAEMGDDAIILSQREVPGGIEVRAATDRLGGGMVPSDTRFLSRLEPRSTRRLSESPIRNRVRDALLWHGVPERIAVRVADSSLNTHPHAQDISVALAAGLDNLVECHPLPPVPTRDLVLIGAPGHGRTATAAKLTRRAAVAKAEVLPIAADLDNAAGGAQLAAYLEREKEQIRDVRTPDDLFATLRECREADKRCIIDLPAIAPFDEDDLASLQDLLAVIDAEPILVISAEGHPDDLTDAVRAFSRCGIRRAIVTKLDITRRRGGILAALSAAKIAFSHLAVTPFIGGGLVPATASRLAHLLTEDAPAHVALKGAA